MKPLIVYESKWLKYVIRNKAATTFYPFILFKWKREEVASPLTQIFKHEMWHWRRAQKDGPILFLLRYMIEQVKHGYKRNKYEEAARANSVIPLTEEELAWRDGPESQSARIFDLAMTFGFVGVLALFVFSLIKALA